jgi:hypothetical protein
MTLIEMVISISLLGILIGPITAMLLLGFASSNGTRERFADSSSAQLVSAYMIRDIQSATTVAFDDPSGCASGTPRLRLSWGAPTPTDVVYFETVTAGQTELRRASCGSGAPIETLLVDNLGEFTPTPVGRSVRVKIIANRATSDSNAYYQPFTFSFEAERRAS